MSEVWRWVRPSWARAYSLALAAPALWALWALVFERDPGKALAAGGLVLWLIFVLRGWFWYEKPLR